MRSEVTSRSNWAKDSSTLRVSRPMEVVVLNCWVTETKETPWASNSWRDEIIDHVALAAKSAGKAFLKGSQELALDYGYSLHHSGHLTLWGVRVASTMVRCSAGLNF